MVDNQYNNGQLSDDEIDLRELFMVLWKRRLPLFALH